MGSIRVRPRLLPRFVGCRRSGSGGRRTGCAATNTKLRLLTRIAYGFKAPEHLIALAYLDRGGHRPPLPGRT